MREFRLEALEFESPASWRWVLTSADGALVADHQVRLDAGCWQFEAFTDLGRYLRLHATPDRRTEDEARIVSQVGAWIGAQVLGPVGAALANARSATVRVVVSEDSRARSLLFWPLELAYVQGRPLALQDIILVMQLAGDAETSTAGKKAAYTGQRLRVLSTAKLRSPLVAS